MRRFSSLCLATPDRPEPTLMFSPRQFVRIGGALLCLEPAVRVAARPPDVRKGFAFPDGAFKKERLCLTRERRSRELKGNRNGKPEAFRTSGGQAVAGNSISGLEIDDGYMASPPSTWTTCPVIYRASSDRRKQAMRATSSGSAKRDSGICSRIFAR